MHLRHVEVDVLIPKLMREKAKELCVQKVEGAFVCVTIHTFYCMWLCLFTLLCFELLMHMHMYIPVYGWGTVFVLSWEQRWLSV